MRRNERQSWIFLKGLYESDDRVDGYPELESSHCWSWQSRSWRNKAIGTDPRKCGEFEQGIRIGKIAFKMPWYSRNMHFSNAVTAIKLVGVSKFYFYWRLLIDVDAVNGGALKGGELYGACDWKESPHIFKAPRSLD